MSSFRLRFLVPFAAVLLAASSARALNFKLNDEPLRLDLTESMFVVAHLDPGNGDASSANYGEFISRLNAQIAWRNFVFGARLDSSDYVHTPQVGDRLSLPNCEPTGSAGCLGFPVTEGQLRDRFQQHPWGPTAPFVEKLYLSYSSRALDATVGDSYVSFGRGLVLSIRKLDELGLDTTVQGAKATVRVGNFSATAVGGWTNTQNLIEATSKYVADPHDLIAGLRADYRIADKVTVGLQGAGGKPNEAAASQQNDRYLRYGMSIDAPRPTSWLALYGEYAHQQDIHIGQPNAGNAYYGSATIYAGRATWLAEFKSYTNFQPWLANSATNQQGSVVYNAPPTLERITTQLSNNSDTTAGRVRLDYCLSDVLTLYLSPEYGHLQPVPGEDDSLIDVYGGAQVRWNDGKSHAFPLLGWRRETKPDGSLEERLFAIEGEATQALWGPYSMELSGLIWFRDKPDSSDRPWHEGNVYLAFKSAPRWEVTTGYEFTTSEQEELHQHNFFNGSVQWNITPSTSLRLFGGGQRPGLKCVSGICRFFPAFQGVRLEFVGRL